MKTGELKDVRITFEPYGDDRAHVVALSLKGRKEIERRFGFMSGYVPKTSALDLSRDLQEKGLRCN